MEKAFKTALDQIRELKRRLDCLELGNVSEAIDIAQRADIFVVENFKTSSAYRNIIRGADFTRTSGTLGRGFVDGSIWRAHAERLSRMFDQIIDSLEQSPDYVAMKNIRDLRSRLAALQPLDYAAAQSLKKRARMMTEKAFGDDHAYVVEIANVNFEPPFHWNPMAEAQELEEAALRKWAEAVADVDSTLETMLVSLETPELIPSTKQKPESTKHSISVQGDHNIITFQSPGTTVGPAPLDVGAIAALVANNADATAQLKALVAELRKPRTQTSWTKIVDIASGIIRLAPTAAKIIGPWLGHPQTVHYADALPPIVT